MARTCSQCGKSYPDDKTFCIDDGSPLILSAEAFANTMMGGAGTKEEPVYAVPAHLRAVEGTTTGSSEPATATSQQAVAPAFEEPKLIALAHGTAVGEYVIDKQIGEGGMGVI